jgi:PAS domain S-box-containing protein
VFNPSRIRQQESAEDRLLRSEERFRTIFENAPVMIDSFDEEGRCLLWNKECEKNLGYTHEEVLACDDPLELFYPDPELRDQVIETIQRADGAFREYEVPAKDGSIRTQLWADFRLPDGTLISVGYDITERKQAERALAESEVKYRAIFSEARDGIVLIDSETGRIYECNPEFERQTGRSLDELKRMRLWELCSADQVDRGKAIYDARGSGQGGSTELDFMRPDGSIIQIDSLSSLVTISGRRYVKAITRDVTERKLTEDALRERDARLRLMVEQMPAVLWTTDRDLRFTSSVGSALRAIGLEPNQAVGMTLYEYFQTDDPDYLPIAQHRRVLEGDSVSYETIWGDHVFESHTEPLRNEKGDIIGCIGIALDITERRHAEERLRRSEERYSKLFHYSNDGLYVYDFDGAIIDVNEKAVAQVGYSKSEMLNMRVKDLVVNDEHESLRRALDILKRKGFVSFELPLRKKSGEQFLGEVSGSIVQIGDKQVIQGIVRDITERKRAEEQLRALAARLQSVREEESIGIAQTIHDELGQTLTALKFDVDWIRRRIVNVIGLQDKPEVIERLVTMMKDIDATVETVRKISTKLRPVILDRLGLLGALEWHAREFEKRTDIRCHFLEKSEVNLDEERSTAVFRIFQEILTNVARHADADEVEVSVERDDDVLVLRVADNGRGISDEEIASTTALGIRGMKERAQVCGGRVHIQAASGGGTEFIVRIPMV